MATTMALQRMNCVTCTLVVLVEKFSSVHTTVQWVDRADRCPRVAVGDRPVGSSERACNDLHKTIDDAVKGSRLPLSHIELPEADAISRAPS